MDGVTLCRVLGSDIAGLLARQDGVISRRQVLVSSGCDNDIERLIRRREWARVHQGVYVDHTGPLGWHQRAWAGVLLHWPAALAGRSALTAHGMESYGEADSAIEVVVARGRRVDDPPGVRTSQLTRFESLALMNLGPPRVRVEHAALCVASRAATADRAVAVLGQACQERRTTPGRLLEAAHQQPRMSRRALLIRVLEDIAAGTNSALERRYLLDVERAHGLPIGLRQRRVVNGRRSAYRDVDYQDARTVVELDGRLGHDGTADRWDDLDRDLAAAVSGHVTIRVGWRQVLEPCRLAEAVATILVSRGWPAAATPCRRCPR